MQTANYLDVTFNLNSGTYYPYRKPNDQQLYINTNSNHPPRIIKQLPDNISQRISNLSCNETEFNKTKPIYENALKSCGLTHPLTYNNHGPPTRTRKTDNETSFGTTLDTTRASALASATFFGS